MLIDIENLQNLTTSTLVESMPTEYNILLGSIFLFIGIVFIIRIYLKGQRDSKKLKQF